MIRFGILCLVGLVASCVAAGYVCAVHFERPYSILISSLLGVPIGGFWAGLFFWQASKGEQQ